MFLVRCLVDRAKLHPVSLEKHLHCVREEIVRSGRDPKTVTIVAVTKRFSLDVVKGARSVGLTDFGENFAQELVAKAEATDQSYRWHMIGQIQRNKVKMLARHVSIWHGLSSERAADHIARFAPKAKVFAQVNLTSDPQRGGCPKAEIPQLVVHAQACGLEVLGLMVVADPDREARPQFAEVRKLGENLGLQEFSMGMSGDYRDALAEGATLLRLGSVLFGPRKEG